MKKSKSIRSVFPFQNYSLFVDERDLPAFQVACRLFESLDTPVSLGMYLKVKYGEFLQVAEASIDPLTYDDHNVWLFERDYQAISFLRKYPNLPILTDRKAVAFRKFLDCEEQCAETNRRIARFRESCSDAAPHLREALCLAMGKISQILGDLDWEEFARSTGWGPGATDVAHGSYTAGYNKFSGPLSVTENCLPLALTCINTTAPWASYVSGQKPDSFEVSLPVSVLSSALTVAPGGKVIFVPKDAKTDRTIIVPVSLNSYCQKGFGNMIKKRLKRAGVDLKDQTFNQRHALAGSRFNDRATLDAVSASDCLSIELVHLLLPKEWVNALEFCRECNGYVKEEKRWIYFHKFSAMGNSYTFELESLIFYALCWAVMKVCRQGPAELNIWTGHPFPDVVSTFGDDMIVPSDCVGLTREVLSFCGFELNMSKTHVDGPFRESCGKDYFAGQLVRPLFLKERVTNDEAIYKLANNIRRFAHRSGSYNHCDRRFGGVWRFTCALLRAPVPLKISEGFGDVGLISNLDEASPPLASVHRKMYCGWEGWRMRMLHHFPVKESMYQYGPAMATYLSAKPDVARERDGGLLDLKKDWGIRESLPYEGRYDLRGRTNVKVISSVVTRWYNLGPWL